MQNLNPLSIASPLWADLYALTMAQSLFNDNRHLDTATFHAYIRATPYGGSYLISAGQGLVAQFLQDGFTFSKQTLAYLQSLNKFTHAFLAFLEAAACELKIEVLAEGDLAFADVPIYRVTGPIWQGLLVEALILNTLNSQALIATEAARLSEAAGGAPILEFGLRRAHDIGGIAASRAAYIGGVAATSNLLAGYLYDIPVAGTFAHALIMAYADEEDAFASFAKSYPNTTVFLVDTYDSLRGVKRMIAVCQKQGITPFGIRLDSGDLTWLSIEARKLLDAAGFKTCKIVASNDLTPMTIAAIRAEGGRIDLWGVGTALVTASGQPSLGAVYKLAEINGKPVLKISEHSSKTSLPGAQSIRRYSDSNGLLAGDVIVPQTYTAQDLVSVRRDDPLRKRAFGAAHTYIEPLVPLQPAEPLQTARARAQTALKTLDASHRRLLNPHRYVVGVEQGLFTLQTELIANAGS